MSEIGIFFGSDTGNTENIAKNIQKKIGKDITKIFDISKCNKKDLEKYNQILFGIPTWYYGEAQCDWDDFFPTLKKIDFSNKSIAIFGCGDQEDYTEYFCDAMGIIKNIIEKKGAHIVGHWSVNGYNFDASKGLINDNFFVGLPLDEDRQPELTNKRINQWIEQILFEMNIKKNINEKK